MTTTPMTSKSHVRNGRKAKQRRQDGATDRLVKILTKATLKDENPTEDLAEVLSAVEPKPKKSKKPKRAPH